MLTDTAIRNLEPRDHPYRRADAQGLSIEVKPTGAKYWRYRFRWGGREQMLSFGVYPEVKLKEARDRREEVRRQIRDGINPAEARRQEKRAARVAADNTFEAIAEIYLAREVGHLSPSTVKKNRWLLETHIFPYLGHRPIAEIRPPELLEALRKLESRGNLETAQRVKQKCGQVFRFAITEGKAEIDPTASLRGALHTPKTRHHAAITEPKDIGGLLRAIDGYSGHIVTIYALKLAPLVFVRPGELRGAEWCEIDMDAGEWRIPAERMKMNAAHLVPLSKQAVAILWDLFQVTGSGKYLFPSITSPSRPISENTLNAALRRLGYGPREMTAHGFRAMASSRLNELGWNPDAIERQLAHAESNKVRAAYNHGAEYLEERRRMMQKWADYLDVLRKGTGP